MFAVDTAFIGVDGAAIVVVGLTTIVGVVAVVAFSALLELEMETFCDGLDSVAARTAVVVSGVVVIVVGIVKSVIVASVRLARTWPLSDGPSYTVR